MTGSMETAGDLATGMLVGRAVEPRAGEGAAHAARELCLNCGTALTGEHCHHCGQSGHVHRTVGAIGHELAHGVFHFEGKIWRTLPMLAFRPGELTRRYVAGERARFVSPLALFLFSVFLMFAVVANLPGMDFGNMDGIAGADFDRARASVADELLKTQAQIIRFENDLSKERAAAKPDLGHIADIERDLASARENLQALGSAQRYLPSPDDAEPSSRSNDARTKLTVAGNESVTFDDDNSWLATKYRHATENPKLLIYKIKTSAYKYSWALIPISLPFIWLLFPLRRDVGMYDHAIFATYSLSFMSLLVILLSVLGVVGIASAWLFWAAAIIPPFHIYKQLKGTYRLSRPGALWRTAWMLFFTIFTSTAFILLLLTVGVSD